MRLSVALLTAVAALTLSACASTPPEQTQYLMRAPRASQPGPVAQPRVGISRVVVAPYLQKLGLVVETTPGQVHSARFHEWAEPLDQGLRRFLVPAMATRLGEPVGGGLTQAGSSAFRVDLYVDQLHGTSEGDARLVADWRIVDGAGAEVGRGSLVEQLPIVGTGYRGLAETELLLADELASAIADSLRGVLEN